MNFDFLKKIHGREISYLQSQQDKLTSTKIIGIPVCPNLCYPYAKLLSTFSEQDTPASFTHKLRDIFKKIIN